MLESRQTRRLNALLDYARQYSPYYRDLLTRHGFAPKHPVQLSDLANLPVTNRSGLRDRLTDVLSTRVSRDACIIRKTSGTSGVPLELPELPSESFFSNTLWARFYMRAGLRPWHTQTKITILSRFGTRRHPIQRFGLFRRSYVDSMLSADEKINVLRTLRPSSLVCWAVTLDEVTRRLEKTGSRLVIPLVFSTANMLWPDTRQRAAERLHARVVDVYGAIETGPVAWECGASPGFHVQSDHVIVELIDENGRPGLRGRVVCTVLWRRAVPIIRYDLGDEAEWDPEPCPCGSHYPRIKSLSGRVTDLIRLPDNSEISSVTLRNAFIGKPGIEQYQLVQESPTDYRLRIVASQDYTPSIETALRDEFARQFSGRLSLRIVHVDRINLPAGVKFSPMVSQERLRQLASTGINIDAFFHDLTDAPA